MDLVQEFRKRPVPQEATAFGRTSAKAISSMTAQQQEAFFNYLYYGFGVNGWLQGRWERDAISSGEQFRTFAETLFAALKRSPRVPKTLQLYRGMRLFTASPEIQAVQIGDRLRFLEFGFVSTSEDRAESLSFATHVSAGKLLGLSSLNPVPQSAHHGVLIRFQLGHNVRGIRVPDHFDPQWAMDNGGMVMAGLPEQQEVLLPPGYHYTLLAKDRMSKANRVSLLQSIFRKLGVVSENIYEVWTVRIDRPKRIKLRRLKPCRTPAKIRSMMTQSFGRNVTTLQCADGQPMQTTT